MAQRQFRSDDTSKWSYGFGSGSSGNLTIASDTTDSTANTNITGTSGGTSTTFGSGTGFANGNLVLIHQSRGTGAGNWELNKISSGGGTTSVTMEFSLINTYGTGAQVYLLTQYRDVVINSGKTLTSTAWNGTKGGIIALLSNTSITITGSISLASKGFRNTQGVTGSAGAIQYAGEGNVGAEVQQNANNGNGGGGGQTETGAGQNNQTGGGGGGNGGAGNNGKPNTGNPGTTLGTGGAAVGNAGLTVALFGGAGGNPGRFYNDTGYSGSGLTGGGFLLVIAPTITATGGISLDGGSTSVGNAAPMGAGAGGSALFKGQIINLGSGIVTASGGTVTWNAQTVYGAGGVGRIHADYSGTFSGTTTPTIDTRQDPSIVQATGAFLFNMT